MVKDRMQKGDPPYPLLPTFPKVLSLLAPVLLLAQTQDPCGLGKAPHAGSWTAVMGSKLVA